MCSTSIRRANAILLRCLRLPALAFVFAIARWLWSKRIQGRVEDDKNKSPIISGDSPEEMPSFHAGLSGSLPLFDERRALENDKRKSVDYKYDCFLSHKHSDCHDICLRISDNLKFKGVLPFIDRECLKGMDSLTEQVRCSRVFFFFLTKNVFQLAWCMLELVEADIAGVILVPVLMEGAEWGPHGVRKFPDVELDCCEEYEPMPGIKIHPQEALRRLFSIVALDLSRTYFDPFLDKLAARVKSARGGTSAAGQQQRRMDSKISASNKEFIAGNTAEVFWRSTLGSVEKCSWASFELALSAFLAGDDDKTKLDLIVERLKGAIYDHRQGGCVQGESVNYSVFTAMFAGGNFKDTLRAMASESSTADVVFNIIIRVPNAKAQDNGSIIMDYLVDDERSTSFVMLKSSDTLARVRQTIMDAFSADDVNDDTDNDSGLDFLGEGNFSFVFQVGAGMSGKSSGAIRWMRARRQQERRVTAVGLTNLCMVKDKKAAAAHLRWDRLKGKVKARAKGGSFQLRHTASTSGYDKRGILTSLKKDT